MRLRRIVAFTGAAALVATAGLVAAPSASANQIWHQAVAVPSASSPCPTTTPAEAQAGWSAWKSSWDQWPNGGKGGFVCNRSITWAYEGDGAGPSGPGCVHALTSYWFDFRGADHLGAPVTNYTDGTCTTQASPGFTGWNVVYTTGGLDAAKALCTTYFGGYRPEGPYSEGFPVYGCQPVA